MKNSLDTILYNVVQYENTCITTDSIQQHLVYSENSSYIFKVCQSTLTLECVGVKSSMSLIYDRTCNLSCHYCNSCEERAAINIIDGCPVFKFQKLDYMTGTRIVAPVMADKQHASLLVVPQNILTLCALLISLSIKALFLICQYLNIYHKW